MKKIGFVFNSSPSIMRAMNTNLPDKDTLRLIALLHPDAIIGGSLAYNILMDFNKQLTLKSIAITVIGVKTRTKEKLDEIFPIKNKEAWKLNAKSKPVVWFKFPFTQMVIRNILIDEHPVPLCCVGYDEMVSSFIVSLVGTSKGGRNPSEVIFRVQTLIGKASNVNPVPSLARKNRETLVSTLEVLMQKLPIHKDMNSHVFESTRELCVQWLIESIQYSDSMDSNKQLTHATLLQ